MSEGSALRPLASPYVEDGRRPVPWAVVAAELERSFTYWAATLHPTGRPHLVPLLGVVNDESLHFAAGPGSQKIRNLTRDPAISVTTHGEAFDVVLEGTARRVDHHAALTYVADAYMAKYGWEVDVVDGALWGKGAPSAGPPPYHVYRVAPHRAFGFPTDGDATPTRWTF
jgi:hypothetical protein